MMPVEKEIRKELEAAGPPAIDADVLEKVCPDARALFNGQPSFRCGHIWPWKHAVSSYPVPRIGRASVADGRTEALRALLDLLAANFRLLQPEADPARWRVVALRGCWLQEWPVSFGGTARDVSLGEDHGPIVCPHVYIDCTYFFEERPDADEPCPDVVVAPRHGLLAGDPVAPAAPPAAAAAAPVREAARR